MGFERTENGLMDGVFGRRAHGAKRDREAAGRDAPNDFALEVEQVLAGDVKAEAQLAADRDLGPTTQERASGGQILHQVTERTVLVAPDDRNRGDPSSFMTPSLDHRLNHASRIPEDHMRSLRNECA